MRFKEAITETYPQISNGTTKHHYVILEGSSEKVNRTNFQKQKIREFHFQFWLGWFSIINNLIII
jgi:hypothetical protein